MLLERGLEREGNRSVFWKGQDQNLLGHRLALVSDGPWSASHLSMLVWPMAYRTVLRLSDRLNKRSVKKPESRRCYRVFSVSQQSALMIQH